MKLERIAKSAAATERIARDLAKRVHAPIVFLLEGELGAGKTTFVRGFVRALEGGRDVVVQSPTFALARTYATRPVVHHLDLYRLDDGVDRALEELGLSEMLRDPEAIAFVEWPRDLSPPSGVACARVQLSEWDGGRRVIVDVSDAALAPPAPAAKKQRPRKRATTSSKATKVRRTTRRARRA